MRNPCRLVDAGDDFQRELIRSAFSDRPKDGAVEDMLVGLGVGVTALSSAVASTAPSAAAGSKLGGAALLKWLVTGAALGVASAGGMHLTVRALEARHVPALKSSEQRASRAASARERSRRTATELAPPATEPRATPPRAPVEPVARSGGNEPLPARSPDGSPESAAFGATRAFALEAAPSQKSTLADETRLLDSARRALAHGDAALALTNLASYARAFPRGALRPEASVLEVRARLAAGDRAGAEALARRVIERAPRSEHADAVRAALARESNP